jgi:hypothetical protein
MAAILLNLFIAIGLVMFGTMLYNAFFLLPKKIKEKKTPSIEDYLFKISRVTGHSEYDVFCKSAEDWPVSRARIDKDFKNYLNHQEIPHYVTDFVRRNKVHIDELQLPRF